MAVNPLEAPLRLSYCPTRTFAHVLLEIWPVACLAWLPCTECHNTYIYRLHYRIHPPNCVSNGHYKTTSLLSHHTQTTKNRLRLLVIISNRTLFKTQNDILRIKAGPEPKYYAYCFANFPNGLSPGETL